MKKFTVMLAAFVLSFGIMAGSAFALDLAAAKKAGYVGELTDGLIGPVFSDASPEVLALVESTNKGRMEVYKKMAEKQGIVLTQMQAIAAQKLYDLELPGNYVQINGAWSVKPVTRR